MVSRLHVLAFATWAALAAGVLVAQNQQPGQTQPPPRPQQPARDTPAQRNGTPQPAAAGSAHISGRVVAADSGRPVRRARVMLNAPELPGGRAILTDDQGMFSFADLPAGRYTLAVSKTGFINLSY